MKIGLKFMFLFFVFFMFGIQSVFANNTNTNSSCDLSGFITFVPESWHCKGGTAAYIRDRYFNKVFPFGMIIGGKFKTHFSSSAAIRNYLPDTGSVCPLNKNYVDSQCTSSGVFCAQLAALYLTVKFGNAGYLGKDSLLGSLVIVVGPLAGISVNQLLNLANIELGGGSTPYSIKDLFLAVCNVNKNFEHGTQDLGFLSCNSSLPVELSSFNTKANGKNVSLIWETMTEKNSYQFTIEREKYDATWEPIGSVQAAVLSNSLKLYSFTDKNLQSGIYQYRLKMTDNDGSFSYSSIKSAQVDVPKEFSVSQNYPNPFNPSTKIDYQVPMDAKVVVEVFNIVGQKVSQLVNQEQSAGYYSVDFNASKLSSGVYLYSIIINDKATGKNFSSLKKMMLIK